MNDDLVDPPGRALLAARHTNCRKVAAKFWVTGAGTSGTWERYPAHLNGCTCSPEPFLPAGEQLAAAIAEAKTRPAPADPTRALRTIPC